MTDDAILGNYADFKLVKTRSVIQIVIEIPVERSKHALELLGGMPTASEECPVALVRLKPQTAAIEAPMAPDTLPAPRKPAKLSQMAGILCNEPAFWRFLVEEYGFDLSRNADEAADVVRILCRVKSRSELDTDHLSGASFKDIEIGYRNWLRGIE